MSDNTTVDYEKIKKLQALAKNQPKGKPRRNLPKKSVAAADKEDKKLQAGLKRLNMQNVAGMEEVNMFKDDNRVLHFAQPKAVHTAQGANTFAIYGKGEDKELTDLVPGIISQLGPESLNSLRQLAMSYQSMHKGDAAKEEDDVPDLVESFEDVANQENKIEEVA